MAKNSPIFIEIGQGLSLMVGLPTINSWTSKERPMKAKTGTFGFNSQTNNLEYYDGTQWLGASMRES